MNKITQNVSPCTLENILEKIFIFGVQHLKSGTLIANLVVATLEDIELFQCWIGIFSYTECAATKHYFIEPVLFQQPGPGCSKAD